MSEKQQINIENIHDCFVQIPWLVDDADLDVYEFRLLVHYYRVGNCWENTTTTAGKCHMSRPQVIKTRKSLADKGWINIKTGGAQDSLVITVIDRWAENHQKYGKKTAPTSQPQDTATYGGQPQNKGGHVVDPKYIDTKYIQSLNTSEPPKPELTREPLLNNGETEYDPQKHKPKKPTAKQRKTIPAAEIRPIQGALCEVLGYDTSISSNWSRVSTLAVQLHTAKYTPENIISAFGKGGAWYKEWPGDKGQLPRLNDISARIKHLVGKSKPAYDPEEAKRRAEAALRPV